MRRLACWIVPALLLAGCGTKEQTPPQPSQEARPAPGAAGQPPGPALPEAGSGGPVKEGSTVHFHYVMKADGEVQMDTHGRRPGTYVHGTGQIFPALEAQLLGMKPGEKKTVTLKPEDAFGARDETRTQRIPKTSFPQPDSIRVGQVLGGMDEGQRVTATVKEIGADDVLLDMNHPLAGKTVTFEVEIHSVE